MSREPMIPALRALGDSFAALEAAEDRVHIVHPDPSVRRVRPRRLAVMVAALTLVAAAVAGADRIFIHSDGALRIDRGDSGGPVVRADTGIALAVATDPSGELPWGVRIEERRGETRVIAGRVRDGRLGVLDRRGAFRALPARAPATCADLGGDGVIVAADRRSLPRKRTVVYGVAGPRARDVRVVTPSGIEPVTPARDGSFVLVSARVLPPGSPRVTWRARGRTVERALP